MQHCPGHLRSVHTSQCWQGEAALSATSGPACLAVGLAQAEIFGLQQIGTMVGVEWLVKRTKRKHTVNVAQHRLARSRTEARELQAAGFTAEMFQGFVRSFQPPTGPGEKGLFLLIYLNDKSSHKLGEWTPESAFTPNNMGHGAASAARCKLTDIIIPKPFAEHIVTTTTPQTAQDVLTAAKVPFEAWPKALLVAAEELSLFQMVHVQEYELAMLATASHSSLLALLDQDLQDRLRERVGAPAVAESNRVLQACHARMCQEATAQGGMAKVLAVVGGAVMMIYCKNVQPFHVAIVETSPISGMQPDCVELGLCGAPKEGNAHRISSCKSHLSRAKATLLGENSRASVHGEVLQVMSEQLRRTKAAHTLDLTTLDNAQLGRVTTDLWLAMAPRTRQVAVVLASFQAFTHDPTLKNPHNDTQLQGLFHFNGWDQKEVTALVGTQRACYLADLGSAHSIVGCNETQDLADYWNIPWPKLILINVGLSAQFYLRGQPDHVKLLINWDTTDYREALWAALGGVGGRPFAASPALATAQLRTLGEGYDGAMVLLALGIQLVVAVWTLGPGGARREQVVVMTTQLPPHDGLRGRPLFTIGGHIGRMLTRVVVRSEGQEAAATLRGHIQRAAEALAGTACMTLEESVQHLLKAGALRVEDTTPPIISVVGHHDANVAPAYEVCVICPSHPPCVQLVTFPPPALQMARQYPLMTQLGNLNITPDVIAAVESALADMTRRRRIIPFQQSTGSPPPTPFQRFVGPTGY